MIIYLLLILLCTFFLFIEEYYLIGKTEKRKKRIINISLFLLALLLILVSAFRSDRVGIDTATYHEWYDSFKTTGFSHLSSLGFFGEPGFAFINILFNKVGASWNAFKLFSSAIFIIPFFLVYKKYSSKPMLSILLFVLGGGYFFIFSTIRQGIAMGIVLIALLLARKKTIILSIAFFALSITVHSTSIVFALYYASMLVSLKNTKQLYRWCIVCLVVAVLGTFALRTVLINYAFTLLHKDYQIDSSTGGYLTALFYIGIFSLLLFFIKGSEKNEYIEKNQIILKLFLICITLFPIVAFSPSTFRAVMFFSFAADILYVNTLTAMHKNGVKILVGLFFSFAYIYLFIFTMMIPSKGLNPYSFTTL